MAERSLAKQLWYEYLKVGCRMAAAGLFHIRCTGRENEPREGGALVLSNHQSLFDPVLVGLTLDRRLNYMARETLFAFAPFRWLIKSLDAIPIDREGLGLAGLKETLRRVKRGEWVLIFPEGTRSPNGEVARLKPGFAALAKRAKVALVPVGIEGAYQAWPRNRLLPGVTTIHVHVGKPISPEEAQAADERELVAEVERRIRHCHAVARDGRLRAQGQRSTGRAELRIADEQQPNRSSLARQAM
jgi:1-acyl-sn-glycerol-3-phosphate acyltransferase